MTESPGPLNLSQANIDNRCLSVVMPVYNETATIRQIVNAVVAQPMVAELVVVDDGSRDRTWEVIEELAAAHPNVSGIGFSRNFGKEAALLAGLDACDGDCVILMDADLQHPPDVLPKMVHAWKEGGYQIVHGVKLQRHGESWFRRVCSKLVFGTARAMSGLELQGSSDFKLLDREVDRRRGITPLIGNLGPLQLA